jgi:hypothetical protein
MRMSVDADLKRLGRHNAGGKLAGSKHMFWRRVLPVWAYGMDSILVVCVCPLSMYKWKCA